MAARKDYGGNDIVSCVIDAEKEIFSVTARKTIVDEVTDPYTEISKEDAAAIDPASVERGFIDIKLDPRKFGRVVRRIQRTISARACARRKEDRCLRSSRAITVSL